MWRSKQKHIIIQQIVITQKNVLVVEMMLAKEFKMREIKLANKIIILMYYGTL